MMKTLSKISNEELYSLYITKNLTRLEIAELLNCKESSVKYRLKLANIKKPTELRVEAIQKECIKKYGLKNGGWTKASQDKIKKTNLKKFGVEFSIQNPTIKSKSIETIRNRYGVDNVFKSEKIKRKIRKTMHQNDSFKQSKEEDLIYEMLTKYFGKVERQYFSEQYPFKCDFYIPKRNLYIEYQGFWMHGSHAFDEQNEEDVALVNLWKSKSKLTYKAAIETWTVRDPKKRKIAKQNNLNWLEFFNLKEFKDWFDSLCPIS